MNDGIHRVYERAVNCQKLPISMENAEVGREDPPSAILED